MGDLTVPVPGIGVLRSLMYMYFALVEGFHPPLYHGGGTG